VPRTFFQATCFIAGFWLALALLTPRPAPGVEPEDADLARLEARLHEAVNAFRREQNLIPLERDASLDAVARGHSVDMATRGFFAHESPEGADWVARLERAGIAGFSMAGENVGLTSRADPNTEILEGWKHSPVHRRNLVARPFNRTGIGIARAADGTLYYTQLYLTFPR
jgi:uncharacterized protein YkwD